MFSLHLTAFYLNISSCHLFVVAFTFAREKKKLAKQNYMQDMSVFRRRNNSLK